MTEQTKVGLLPCPFCGVTPDIETWHGGKPTKHMVSCCNDECSCAPQCTGQTHDEAIKRWNVRAAAPVVTWSGLYTLFDGEATNAAMAEQPEGKIVPDGWAEVDHERLVIGYSDQPDLNNPFEWKPLYFAAAPTNTAAAQEANGSKADGQGKGTSAPAVAPIWYFVATDGNIAKCRGCGYRELLAVGRTRKKCPSCGGPEKAVSAAPSKPESTLPLSAEEIRLYKVDIPQWSVGHNVCDMALAAIELKTRATEAERNAAFNAQLAAERGEKLAQAKQTARDKLLGWEEAESRCRLLEQHIAGLRHDIARSVQTNQVLLAESAKLLQRLNLAERLRGRARPDNPEDIGAPCLRED